LGANTAIAEIEPVPTFDLEINLAPWEQRRANGKALCRAVPRESHAEWKPGKNRPDPLKLPAVSNEGRQKHLVRLRLSRMPASPFAFLSIGFRPVLPQQHRF